ncbi:MAG: flavodoxin family protein [Armatimonadota bacterium]|nr:flavodoxin family protein [Armatimonadota bacterium]
MRIVAVVGSPRAGGNTDVLVDRIIAGATSLGAHVDRFFLADMDIRPCRGCEGCRQAPEHPCVVDDDMQEIHERLRACDGVIVGTPIYWFTMSAYTKIFMDRWYALGAGGPTGHALQGKRFAFAMTYADPDALSSGALNAYRTFQDACRWLGGEIVGFVHGVAWEKGEIARNEALMKQAELLGRRLAGGR